MLSSAMLLYLAVAGVLVFALVVVFLLYGRERETLRSFLIANRRVPILFGGLWVAVAWTWGATFFIGSQKAYEDGLAGFGWYALANSLALVLFAFLVIRIRGFMREYRTLPEFIESRFDRKTKNLYAIAIIFIQGGYVLAVQLIGAALLLNFATGVNKTYIILIVAAAMILLAVVRGIRSSGAIDIIKGSLMAMFIFVLGPLAVWAAGGFSSIAAGLAGQHTEILNFFGPDIISRFGIPIAVALLSGAVVDQSLWQRTFSVREGALRGAYLWGAAFFFLNVLALGFLGFIAANASLGLSVSDSQLAGFAVIGAFLPPAASILFIITVIVALIATGASALNAASSIGSVDVYKQFRPNASESETIRFSRLTMLFFIGVGTSIALTGIDILSLVIVVGIFRSALFFPTIVGLVIERARMPHVFTGIVIAMCTGVPLFIAGYKITGALASWAITAAYCLYVYLKYRNSPVRETA